jgi:hypothetical protein
MRRLALLSFVLLPACVWVTDVDAENRKPEMDDDGDGAPAYRDCNDADPGVRPGATDGIADNLRTLAGLHRQHAVAELLVVLFGSGSHDDSFQWLV